MTWNWEALEFWLAAATVAISAVAGFVGRALRNNSRRIDTLEASHSEDLESIRAEARTAVRSVEIQLEAKVERHDREITALKAAQITHEDLGRIYARLEPVATELAGVKGEVKAMHGTLKAIVQHLIGEK